MRKRHQRGSLTKVNGRWVAQWRQDGQRRKRRLGLVAVMTKAEATKQLEELLTTVNQGAGSPSSAEPLDRFVDFVFLPFYKRKWKRSTAITCESRIRNHVLGGFGSRPLGGFGRVELQDWLESKAGEGLSHSTIDHLRWDLSQIFKMAAAEGCISRSPAALLFTPRAARTAAKRRMSLEEVNRCFEVLDQRERLIAMLALTAGMRPGEILALQWKHVRPDHIEVVQRVYHQEIDTPKTKRSVRSVALSPVLKASLESWREVALSDDPEAWLFPSEHGRTPVIAENIWRRNFLPRLKAVGLEWATFLVMRRTHASLMRDLDVDPKLVADQLGHTLDVSLNVYAKSGLARRGEALALFESRLKEAQTSGAPN
jgi:integrase